MGDITAEATELPTLVACDLRLALTLRSYQRLKVFQVCHILDDAKQFALHLSLFFCPLHLIRKNERISLISGKSFVMFRSKVESFLSA